MILDLNPTFSLSLFKKGFHRIEVCVINQANFNEFNFNKIHLYDAFKFCGGLCRKSTYLFSHLYYTYYTKRDYAPVDEFWFLKMYKFIKLWHILFFQMKISTLKSFYVLNRLLQLLFHCYSTVYNIGTEMLNLIPILNHLSGRLSINNVQLLLCQWPRIFWYAVKIKLGMILKSTPWFFYKNYADTRYEIIDTRKKCRKSFKDLKLCALQNTPKISEEKKKDLLALCNSHAIHKNHWAFYQQLEVDSKYTKKLLILIVKLKYLVLDLI
ncbi:hypothetical protein QTP88_012780 [Uroleucon formosanum]